MSGRSERISTGGLHITEDGGRLDLPWLFGTVDYAHLDPNNWSAILGLVRELGLRLIDITVPWSEHQPRPDAPAFDHAGPRNLRGFLELCREFEIYVIVRPLVSVYMERPRCATPDWLFADAEKALGPDGQAAWAVVPPRPYSPPSTFDPRYREAAGSWLAALGDACADFVFPDGPIVALLADHPPLEFWRDSAFEFDYSPPAIASFEAFVRADDKLAAELGEVSAPRGPRAPLAAQLAWIAHQRASWRRFVKDLRARSGALEQLAWLGLDGPPLADSLAYRKRRARGRRDSRLVVGVPWGGRVIWPPDNVETQTATLLTDLARGAVGVGLNGLVDRRGAFDSPITAAGERGERFDATQLLLKRLEQLVFSSPESEASIVALEPAALGDRARCQQPLEPLPPLLLALAGIPLEALDAENRAIWQLRDRVASSLASHGSRAAWLRADQLSALGDRPIDRLIVLATPTMRRSLVADIQRLSEGSTEVVIVGEVGTVDDLGERVSWPASCRLLSAEDLAELESSTERGAAAEIADALECENSRVCWRIVAREGEPGGLVVDHGGGDMPASIDLSRLNGFDALSGVPITKDRLALEPGEARLLRVRRRD